MQSRIIYIVCYEKNYAWLPAYFETLKLAKEFCIKILDNDPQCGVSIRKAKEFYDEKCYIWDIDYKTEKMIMENHKDDYLKYPEFLANLLYL